MNPQFVLFQMILSLECTSTKTDEFSYQQMNFDVMSQAILGLKGFQASWA
jgi:actin-related protein